MKILLVGFTKIKFMPYMQFYLDNLDRKSNDLSLLYWNRDLVEEDTAHLTGITLYEFKYYQNDDVNKLMKIKSFIKFRSYARKVICRESFDYIIVVHSLPAILLMDLLIKKFKGQYIFDYRDSTFEKINWFKRKVQAIQKNSAFTIVSSDAYRVFFDDSEQSRILTTHNFLLDSLNHRMDRAKFGIASDKIRISFWGLIRNKEINLVLIDRVGDDRRFELHYYGREQDVAHALKEYVKEKKYDNVFFHGEYSSKDRYEFIKTTDIIDNIYENNENLRRAMANKYYDGVIFRIPQVCNTGGFIIGRLISRNNLGLELDPHNDDFCDRLYDYYVQLNWDQFYAKCGVELERIVNEYQIVKEAVANVGK